MIACLRAYLAYPWVLWGYVKVDGKVESCGYLQISRTAISYCKFRRLHYLDKDGDNRPWAPRLSEGRACHLFGADTEPRLLPSDDRHLMPDILSGPTTSSKLPERLPNG